MRKFLKEYFSCSANEKRGVVVLFILIIAGVLFPSVYNKFRKEKVYDYSQFEQQINNLIALNKVQEEELEEPEDDIFVFDPNTLDKGGFKQLGLSDKQANTIIKYRNAGGKFKTPNDFGKIYTLSDADFNRLKPFVKIVKQTHSSEKQVSKIAKESHSSTVKKPSYTTPIYTVIIHLNHTDSAKLTTVRGIGPVFAQRIVNYRNYLGGFYAVTQLNEVYGFTDEMYNKISTNCRVDSSLIQLLNINKITFKQLNKHPYISYQQTKAVFRYKQLVGDFKDLNQLLENNLLDTATFSKAKPYLTIK